MYVSKVENYTLSDRDKLVLTFQDGKLMLLINNTLKVDPSDIKMSVEGYESKHMDDSKIRKSISILNIQCTVEE